ncbi:MAG: hypothetical protein ABH833_03250 [Parcubacteria group bacterium]
MEQKITEEKMTEQEPMDQSQETVVQKKTTTRDRTNTWKLASWAFLSALIITQVTGINLEGITRTQNAVSSYKENKLAEVVMPEQGIVIPVKWDDMGSQMIDAGVIDADKFESLYENRGGLDDSELALMYDSGNGDILMTEENAGVLLNLLWAFGLANKNPILEEGPMVDDQYGGDPGRFASTGGWSLAEGSPMDHYSKYSFVILTPEQQTLVERVSKNIYRPCCGNSVHFPDCNHGMAMLGLLELLASQDIGEEEMYDIALKVNSYWFPDTYMTIAKYFEKRDVAWDDVNSKDILGSLYSSASGYRQVLAEVEPPQAVSGGGNDCGV